MINHDPQLLQQAQQRLFGTEDLASLKYYLLELVNQSATWRANDCLNLVAAEAPSSPWVRQLLNSDLAIRATGGGIGSNQRHFAGCDYIDHMEALAVELLKYLFTAKYADHRLLGGMAACNVVYTALCQPGDMIMTIPAEYGGDDSNLLVGAPGARGLQICEIPFKDPWTVDLAQFASLVHQFRPKLVSLGQTITLLPLPVAEIKSILQPYGSLLYFDAAHQAGLIAGGCYPNPLEQGADIMSGSSGKTFSGPQGGILAWNDAKLSDPILRTIHPMFTGSHQSNRVAALAGASLDLIAYGSDYMQAIITNAKTLARALAERGLKVFAEEHDFTETHQVIVDVSEFGDGQRATQLLAANNIMVNKIQLPNGNRHPSPMAIRLGTAELTRRGLPPKAMIFVADYIAASLFQQQSNEVIRKKVIALASNFREIEYCL